MILLWGGLRHSAASADVILPALFSDHMVLQGGAPVPVWGWAEPGESVTVTIGDQTKTATADAQGSWKVMLEALPGGPATTMTVTGKNSLTIQDVLVGEVWLCSGQSNMQFGVGGQDNLRAEIPGLRVFTEESPGEADPQERCRGKWQVVGPDTFRTMSGTAYFFGRNLQEKLGRPVGLVVSAVGGTPIESWTSRDVLATMPEFEADLQKLASQAAAYKPEFAKAVYEKRIAEWDARIATLAADGQPLPKPKQKPQLQRDPRAGQLGNLFNGKIASLMPYRIAGVIWYQGEANAKELEHARRYAKMLPAMITDWRERWGQGDFPFAWVQLPRYRDDRFPGWSEIRESQRTALAVPNTGMAVMIDTGDPKGIHPNNKAETGRRLALWALATVYGQDIPFSGPLPAGQEVRGNTIICSFTHAEGLKSKDGPVRGFEIAGADKKWMPAAVRIEGMAVKLSSSDVPRPEAIRYGWRDDSDCNLVNGAGLPASPFRTHDWP